MRKLDFLLADAIEKGCNTVLTLGGLRSNHARATAVAARELGLESYVFVLDFNSSLKVTFKCKFVVVVSLIPFWNHMFISAWDVVAIDSADRA